MSFEASMQVLSGGTGLRLVGCLRADGRSFARIGVGPHRPWHTPRPDLSMRHESTYTHGDIDLSEPAATGHWLA